MLLPLRPRRATAAVLRAHRAPATTRQRVSQRAQTTLAQLGAAHLAGSRVVVRHTGAPGQESVITRLWPVVGRPDAVGLHLGPPRANRKPILQLLDSRSRDLAFVKVGSRELTRPLVVAEGNALGRLSTAGLRRVVVPAVLHAESWQGSQLLVLAPVATTSSAQPRLSLLAEAMVEVCGCDRPREPAARDE